VARKKSSRSGKCNFVENVRSDLTGYASLLGESFSARIDMLERVIQSSHYPSLGRYKERLLARVIRDSVPRNIEVGTGFILFPHENLSPAGGSQHYDPLNQSAFSISRQCDILIYDVSDVPPVFRDEDFVIIRPEAVRAVIEVKGSLTYKELYSILESFYDFGIKWKTTQLFYKKSRQALTKTPSLYAMAWKVRSTKNGRTETNPATIRQKIADFYKTQLELKDHNGFPTINKLLVYNEFEIQRCIETNFAQSDSAISLGWRSTDGRFVRFDSQGNTYRDKDRTISSLIGNLHYDISLQNFNRFFSYTDEIRNESLILYKDSGFSSWIDDLEKDPLFRFSDTV